MRQLASDRKSIYVVSLSVLVAFIPLLFVGVKYVRWLAAIAFIVAAVVAYAFVKKRSILSFNKKQVLALLTIIALVYLTLYYMVGLHFGFSKVYRQLSLSSFLELILPSLLIIIASELLRSVILAQQCRCPSVAIYVICIFSDVLIKGGLSNIGSHYAFMEMVGVVLFSSVTMNLLYHYLSKRYGVLPNIVFRSILTLYIYVIPFVPAVPDAINAFALVILPLVVWMFIDGLYEKKFKYATQRTSKWTYLSTAATLAFMISVIMLITCQFRFGLLVIASPSMEGEISVGDAVIFEAYDGQNINKGDVIVFYKDKSDSRTVHRVVNTEKINGQVRYYTKGDANNDVDYGYITESNIEGVVRLKVSGIGYPSLWLRDLFK